MALIKKDRSFDDILSGVMMNELPLKFVASVTLHLSNGSSIIFDGKDLKGVTDVDELLESDAIEEFREMIVDIQITMDNDRLKENVTGYVSTLLALHFKETKQP
jgi:antitoxin component of MazEF toxin-antitoxin module